MGSLVEKALLTVVGVEIAALVAAFHAVEVADRAASHLPLYRRQKDAVLDILLGPAEDFEFVSTTTPPTH